MLGPVQPLEYETGLFDDDQSTAMCELFACATSNAQLARFAHGCTV